MERTLCEFFAGVGGFRVGLNHVHTVKDAKKKELYRTVFYNQYEPAEKATQYAHDCYKYHYGTITSPDGKDYTNTNIEEVPKEMIPDFSLLCAGFPCQDYSVASSLATSKGIQGKKGVLWWSIHKTLEKKEPPFVLLENVDRLLKSPAKQRGRDFGIILFCLNELGYDAEWRVINASDYGFQQRRRRSFIYAYKRNSNYAKKMKTAYSIISSDGLFAKTFPITGVAEEKISLTVLPNELGAVSNNFQFQFENTGYMSGGNIYTVKTYPLYIGKSIYLGDILETGAVDESYFIDDSLLYYTDRTSTHSNEAENGNLTKEERHTWQYIKGAKKIKRIADNGHEYLYTEGAIPMVDAWNKPARTMLTSEGSFSRTTHIVEDKLTKKIRLLTPCETERIQGFPTDWTKYALVINKKTEKEEVVEIPPKKRRFFMGNALVVNIIEKIEPVLSEIIDNE